MTIERGQTWTHRNGRRVRVIGVSGGDDPWATVENKDTNRLTRIALRRFTSRAGWKLTGGDR